MSGTARFHLRHTHPPFGGHALFSPSERRSSERCVGGPPLYAIVAIVLLVGALLAVVGIVLANVLGGPSSPAHGAFPPIDRTLKQVMITWMNASDAVG